MKLNGTAIYVFLQSHCSLLVAGFFSYVWTCIKKKKITEICLLAFKENYFCSPFLLLPICTDLHEKRLLTA